MEKLYTPFGIIEIKIDGRPISYTAEKGDALEELCPRLLGRYQIKVHYVPDGKEHEISCTFIPCCRYERGSEYGENLACQGFYNSCRIKMSIGLLCDPGFDSDYPYNIFDYDGYDLENGMAYYVLEQTKTEDYIFGIAWIDDVGWDDSIEDKYHLNRDSETWYGADPGLCLNMKV